MKSFNINECAIKYGYNNMDFQKVTEMLFKAYWSIGIKIDEVKKGAENSALNTGIFYNSEQIGYARVISDKTRFAYILDVYVDEKFRKKGIGHLMINSILRHEELKDVYQWRIPKESCASGSLKINTNTKENNDGNAPIQKPADANQSTKINTLGGKFEF